VYTLPRVSYLSKLDYWMLGCFLYLCLLIGEAAFVSQLSLDVQEDWDTLLGIIFMGTWFGVHVLLMLYLFYIYMSRDMSTYLYKPSATATATMATKQPPPPPPVTIAST
jgi:hypothetical protein